MENLIKPVDFAKKMGISRQAVYAKIKKGLLTSKNIGGKIFIVQSSSDKEYTVESNSKVTPNTQQISFRDNKSHEDLLKAKDETISILKETVNDLKETNKMITITMRSEVELLKEAFTEMKTLYKMQLAYKKERNTIDVTSIEGRDKDSVYIDANTIELESVTAIDSDIEDTTYEDTKNKSQNWIALIDYFNMNQIQRGRKREKLKNIIQELYEEGNSNIKIINQKYFIIPNSRLIKRLKKAIK